MNSGTSQSPAQATGQSVPNGGKLPSAKIAELRSDGYIYFGTKFSNSVAYSDNALASFEKQGYVVKDESGKVVPFPVQRSQPQLASATG